MSDWPLFLQVDEHPRSGEMNMALDEAALDAAADGQGCFVRLYRWNAPTISLGHFQKEAQLDVPPELADLPRVRRLSGGGAILHDRELTYSFTLPRSHPLADDPTLLYVAMHDVLIAELSKIGVTARLRGEKPESTSTPPPEEAFLCFLREDPRDIVIDLGAEQAKSQSVKIVGSAQRRRRGAVLQHGSILLWASEFSREVPGILNLFEVSEQQVATAVQSAVEKFAGNCSERGEFGFPKEFISL
ncbi:lipoate--protein ligase family protein [Calycomorphotria hydatis]|uniref:Octanoyltransferase LipM n=1 Tax=Calycomorphotria hydatis TaxID=2528027 RepID=A0A517TAP1_9PLAN|nr:lipoate--protein ligase [Calycomorphotria hydatis]QDT65436.1 Octanoyltransferase LipM [Calycomorphotria hydatis]